MPSTWRSPSEVSTDGTSQFLMLPSSTPLKLLDGSKTLERAPETKLLHPAAVGLFDCYGAAVKAELCQRKRRLWVLSRAVD
jgi:hypothetical protein